MRKFTFADLLVKPDSEYQAYHQRDKSTSKIVSWPARKRLLSHIQFLTLYWQPEHKICVYSGSGFQSLLSVLFPNLIFHVYDSAAQLSLTERIQVTPSPLTPELARQYQDQSVLFISQPNIPAYGQYWSKKIAAETRIRLSRALSVRLGVDIDNNGNPQGSSRTQQDFASQLHAEVKEAKRLANLAHETAVWQAVRAQQDLVQTVNPAQAWLAFRLPYPLQEEFKQVAFLAGVVHRLAWSGFESTETALLPTRVNGQYTQSMWDSTAYEGAMFYHNANTRETGAYVNQFTGVLEPVDLPELLNDFDSSLEVFVLSVYQERFTNVTESQLVKDLSKLITSELNKNGRKNKSLSGLRNQSKLNQNDPFVQPTAVSINLEQITPAIAQAEIGLDGVELPSTVIPQPDQIVNDIVELIPVADVNGQSIGVVSSTLEIAQIPGPNGVAIPVLPEVEIIREENRAARRNPFVRPVTAVTPVVSVAAPVASTNPFVIPRTVRPVVVPIAQPVTTQAGTAQPTSVQLNRPIIPIVPVVQPVSGGPNRPIVRPVQPPQVRSVFNPIVPVTNR